MPNVLHVGPDPTERGAGGMGRVISNLLRSADATNVVSMTVNRRFFAIGRLPSATRALMRHRRSPEAVTHVHLAGGGSTIREGGLAWLSVKLGIATVVTVHSSRFGSDTQHRLWGRCIPIVLQAATLVHVLGPEGRLIAQRLVSDASKIKEVPNGVELPRQTTQLPGNRVVVFAGEVGPRKGVDVLFDAWPEIRRSHPDAHLVVVGPRSPGFDRPCPNGSSDRGPVQPADVAAIIEQADVCVLPSRAEAFPMFLLEAMAAGRVCIGSDVGDVPSMLGTDGIIVKAGDVKDLESAVISVLGLSLEDQRALGRRSRERVEASYSVDVVRSAMSALYHGLVGRSLS